MVDGIQTNTGITPGSMVGNPTDVGGRLLRVMAYCGDSTQTAFAKRLGISTSRLNNVITGGRPLSRDLCFKIVNCVPGMTPGWLWHGDARGMPWELVQALGLAELPTKDNSAP
jgi:DNA-binding transcriptional regulator YdaS (Cro superfamily)